MAGRWRQVAGLSQIADRDVLFCDIWGVVHNGVAHDKAACAALTRFRARGGSVILVSNAPRPRAEIIRQLQGLGVPDAAWDRIVTSGDVARREIESRSGQGVHVIGPARDQPLFSGLDAPVTDIAGATYCVCTGFDDDERETVSDYAARLEQLAARRLPMICANPDLVVDRGGRLVPCAGTLAQAYERLGGTVIYAGKPWRPIYETALSAARDIRGKVEPGRILAIGDAIRTDIAGAVRFGVAALLILSGIHAEDAMERDGSVDAGRLDSWLESQDVHPDFVMPSLRWAPAASIDPSSDGA